MLDDIRSVLFVELTSHDQSRGSQCHIVLSTPFLTFNGTTNFLCNFLPDVPGAVLYWTVSKADEWN